MGLLDLNFDSSSQGELDMSIDDIVNLGESNAEGNVEVEPQEGEDKTPIVKDENPDELKLDLNELLKDSEVREDETGEVNDKPSSANTKETIATNSFLLLANALAEEGILPEMDQEDFEKLVEENGSGGKALLHLMNSKLDEVENSIKDSYDADYKEYMQLKELGIQKEDAFDLVSIDSRLNEIDDDILEESEDVRKEILEMHFKNTTRWNDDKISKHVEKLVTAGEDIDAAKEALPELQKYSKELISQKKEEAIKQQESIKKQQEEFAKDIKESFIQDAEIVKNIKLTKAQALKAQELLLTPVELEDGSVTNKLYAERMKDPIAFDKKLAALVASGALEGNATTVKASKKKALDELEKVIGSGAKNTFKGNMEANMDVVNEESDIINSKFLRSIGAVK